MITLIIGGAKSGKTMFAQGLFSESTCYIATGKAFDQEMVYRIQAHKKSRPNSWRTFEDYKNLEEAVRCEENYILDDVTNLILNMMMDIDDKLEFETHEIENISSMIIDKLNKLIDKIKKTNKNIVFVTNELGLSLVPEYKLGRQFRDINGKVNQFLASISDDVFLVVAGIEVKIK